MYFRAILAILAILAQNLFALTSFELHNIDKAHAQGYTGSGVKMGVADTKFNTTHSALQGQFLGVFDNYNNKAYDDDECKANPKSEKCRSWLSHGSNVSSVLAANRTDNKYYGVAYGAKMVGFGEFGNVLYYSEWSEAFMLGNNIKIINHSWGYTSGGYQNIFSRLTQNKVLMVFASGNESQLEPAYPAQNPRHNEALRSWITVGNLDARYITRNLNGTITVQARGVATSSNLCFNARGFCVMASGTQITAADGISDSAFSTVTGTSFSAPLVSGVAALVQEKFPFMDGAQLADTILSTANSDFVAPKMILKGGVAVYIDNVVPDSTQIAKDISDAYGTSRTYTSTRQATKEEVFGQGIVDANKALGGLARLDINRMSDSDITTINGEKSAFYTLDTKGHDAIFSNDITERKWDEKYHYSGAVNKPTQLSTLNAGFIKTGAGTLTMSGKLGYSGATVVRDGTLILQGSAISQMARIAPLSAVAQSTQNTQSPTVAGNMIVESNGTLRTQGAVSLAKSLTNSGALIVGANSALNIASGYTQNVGGSLTLGFVAGDSSAKITANSYDIKGGNLIYQPYITSLVSATLAIPLQDSLKAQISQFSSVSIDSTSQVFDYTLSSDNLSLIITQNANAYANFAGANAKLGAALRELSSNSAYTTYFTLLNNANSSTYQSMINSLNNSEIPPHSAQILALQSKNALDSIVSLQSASNATRFALTPYYSYLFGAHYAGSNISLDKKLGNHALGGFIGYGYLSDKSENISISAQIINAGFSAILDASNFKFIFSANLGGSFNALNRDIFGLKIKGKFNNFFAIAQVGLGYAIKASGATITPQIVADYGFLMQGAFSESADIFALRYDKIAHNALNILAGANYTHKIGALVLGIHAFYERNLLGGAINSAMRFKDGTISWENSQTLGKNGARFGAKVGYEGTSGFFNITIDSRIFGRQKQIGGMANFGFKFGGVNGAKNAKSRVVKKAKSISTQKATQTRKVQQSRESQIKARQARQTLNRESLRKINSTQQARRAITK